MPARLALTHRPQQSEAGCLLDCLMNATDYMTCLTQCTVSASPANAWRTKVGTTIP